MRIDSCASCCAPIGPREAAACFDDNGNVYCDRACRSAELAARARLAELAADYCDDSAAELGPILAAAD